ncbi:winged helix-turn-helix domain-containing protein [Variovorax paradoxus]|uniref:Transcriptional regulatory protein BaeR n=1 Tax=Variovorax paradoxus TaxID=34073 RepID=A0A679J428_VARPD|nr:Transcriptional regulatory protein BaeR [Variovorax paradoxus]
MGRILLVEDGRDSAALLGAHLHGAGHEVEQIGDAEAALERILTSPPALTLLEIVLPRGRDGEQGRQRDPVRDGIDVLGRVRLHSNHPIIMLTARVHEDDRLRALDMGADDYVCKPFSPREVVARVNTVLRRHAQRGAAGQPSAVVAFSDARGNASLEGRPLTLTRRELLLLRALSRAPGRVLTRSKLLEAAFPEALDVNERAVDGHIKNLRRKLAAAAPAHEWIRSVYGVGFSFAERQAG